MCCVRWGTVQFDWGGVSGREMWVFFYCGAFPCWLCHGACVVSCALCRGVMVCLLQGGYVWGVIVLLLIVVGKVLCSNCVWCTVWF